MFNISNRHDNSNDITENEEKRKRRPRLGLTALSVTFSPIERRKVVNIYLHNINSTAHRETHQQNSEVLQHAVHHVFLRQVFELVDEVDHVFAHRRTTDSVDKTPVFKPRVLRL